jgi:hypothetical protein
MIEFAKDNKHLKALPMTRFYEPDLSVHPDSPFIRDAVNKLVRRSYWMDMDDRTLVMRDGQRHRRNPDK